MKNQFRLLILMLISAMLLVACSTNASNTNNLAPGNNTAAVPQTGAENGAVGNADGMADTGDAAGEDEEEDQTAIANDGADVIDNVTFQLVSNMLGQTIYTPAGEPLGTVVDLAFDDITGYVAYLILEPGEGLAVDSDLVAFPWVALGSAEPFEGEEEGAFRSFTFDLDPSVVVESPGFSQADLEERGLEVWAPELYSYWATASNVDLYTGFSEVTVLTQLSGYQDFEVIQGGTLDTFTVQDILINLGTGEVAYFIVPADELPFGGDGLALIPYDYLEFTVLEEGIAGYVFAEGEEVAAAFQYMEEEAYEELR